MKLRTQLVLLGLMLVCLVHAGLLLKSRWVLLPSSLLSQAVRLTCFVDDLPKQSQWHGVPVARFTCRFKEAAVLLSWFGYGSVAVRPGQEWAFLVKLKPAHAVSASSASGFNYQNYLDARGISGVGAVQYRGILQQFQPWRYPIAHFRDQLRDRLNQLMEGSLTQGVILAIALGDQSQISKEQWLSFQRTGTNHLVAVAGLHVGMLAGFLGLCVRSLWAFSYRLTSFCPAQTAGWVAACVGAIFYSALSGFSLPTQRAIIMLICLTISQFSRTLSSALSRWVLALLAVILWDPWCLMQSSVWLSFGAVFFLIYGLSGRVGRQSFWHHLFYPQWILAVGLFPLTAWFFHQASCVGFLANLIAVPCLTFLILPGVLLSCVSVWFNQEFSRLCLLLTGQVIQGLLGYLGWLAHLPFASFALPNPSLMQIFLSLLGALLLLSPRGVPCRYLGLVLMLPLGFS